MTTELKLAELLCTRLCHDLTGPIGAVNNGAEFLEEGDEAMMKDALALIASSAKEAVSRVQYFRQAYGTIKVSGEASLSELKVLCMQFFASGKIKLDWPDAYTDASGVSISRRMGKLMLNMLVIAAETLIRGGDLNLRIENAGGAKRVTVTAEGQMLKLDDEVLRTLDGGMTVDELTARSVQVYLTMAVVQELGAQLQFQFSENRFVISAEKSGD